MFAIGPRHRSPRALRRRWRFAAVAVGLGVLAVAVPETASLRWASVAGLVVLYPVVGSAVMSRRLPAGAMAVAADVAPRPSASGRVEAAAATSTAVSTAVFAGRPASAPEQPAAAPPAVVLPNVARSELLVARGEALHELLVANGGRAPREPTPAAPSPARPPAAVPPRRGATTGKPVLASAPDPCASWVPLNDDATVPTLRSGWPFDSRAAEPAPAARRVVGG